MIHPRRLDLHRRDCAGRIVLVGDVHNQGWALKTLLTVAGVAADDWVLVLGDLVDRGAEVADMVDVALAPQVRFVLGNHDTWLLDNIVATPASVPERLGSPAAAAHWSAWQAACTDWPRPQQPRIEHWYRHYGRETLDQLAAMPVERSVAFLRKLVAAPILINLWRDDAPLPWWTLVHASLPELPQPWRGDWLDQRQATTGALWSAPQSTVLAEALQVAVGHTPVPMVEQRGHYWFCDTGAGKDFNRLSLLDADTLVVHSVACG